MSKSIQKKKDLYVEMIGRCSMPNCVWGKNLEVHHIIPRKFRKDENFDNYLVLCRKCHRGREYHHFLKYKDNLLRLFTIKILIEQKILGFDSSEYDNIEFHRKLRELKKRRKKR